MYVLINPEQHPGHKRGISDSEYASITSQHERDLYTNSVRFNERPSCPSSKADEDEDDSVVDNMFAAGLAEAMIADDTQSDTPSSPEPEFSGFGGGDFGGGGSSGSWSDDSSSDSSSDDSSSSDSSDSSSSDD